MARDSSKAGLGSFLGRGFLGVLSIALTATVSVVVQRSFDWMGTRQLPTIAPALPSSKTVRDIHELDVVRPDLPEAAHRSSDELDSPILPESFSGSGANMEINAEIHRGVDPGIIDGAKVQITLDESTSGATAAEPDADRSRSNSTSRIMQQFWEKLNH
jgi:hypothetical protein